MNRKREPRVSAVGQSIREAVKANPGIHFRGLGRAANVTSAGQLRHHLDRLEHQGILIEVEDGRYKRFFVAGDHDPKLRPEMARFARVVPRRIAKLLLMSPMNRTELRRNLGCADSTLGYHLTRMVILGDLARIRGPNSCVYSLTSGETVRQMLLMQNAIEDALPHDPSGETPNALRPASTPDLANPDDGIPNPLRPFAQPLAEQPFAARTSVPDHPGPGPDAPQPDLDGPAQGLAQGDGTSTK